MARQCMFLGGQLSRQCVWDAIAPLKALTSKRFGLRSMAHAPSGKLHNVLLFKGDGVGPELCDAAVHAIRATGVNVQWREMPFGFDAAQKSGQAVTEEHLQAFEELRVIFKGPITIPPASSAAYVNMRGKKYTSANQVLRKIFNLYANIRPAKSSAGIKTPFSNVDIVVFRENTEDLYTGEEKWVDDNTVEAIKRITRGASERIARAAFEYAVQQGRKRVTAVHKANVCKQSDGLFLNSCAKIAKDYPAIKFDDQLADSLLTKLVQTPQEYDILLCPNMFGDLVSDLAAGLVGSLGLMPSGQFGDRHAVFEPAHGSAPDIAGKGVVNPTSQLRCAVMLLRHLGEHSAAAQLEQALDTVLSSSADDPKSRTRDLGGTASTTEFTQAVVKQLDSA